MSEELREIYKEGMDDQEEAQETEPEDPVSEGDEADGAAGDAAAAADADEAEEPFDAFAATGAFEAPEIIPFHEAEEDYERRIKKRKAKIARKKIRRKLLLVVIIIALFASLATMCGRDIIRLKAENRALQKRQTELEEERDRLKQEVENAGQREYVQDQARKQLRLLNPGELLFTFEDEEKK